MRLDIGCGFHKCSPEFTGVDFFVPTDIKALMWYIPLRDSSVEFIYSSHALEHVEKAKVIPTLREWHRLLVPGGGLVLKVPDFRYAVEYWLSGPDREWADQLIFGNQAREGECHKCCFTEASLKQALLDEKFIIDGTTREWDYDQYTLVARAHKEGRHDRKN